MLAILSGRGTPARLSPSAVRENPDPTFYENRQGKLKMDALREQISEFQSVEAGLRIERVQAAHCDGP